MNTNRYKKVAIIAGIAFGLMLLVTPVATHADSFSFRVYPNDGFFIGGCGDSGCARTYQYGQDNFGISFAQPQYVRYEQHPIVDYSMYVAPQYVRYAQPVYHNYYQQHKPSYYIPYVVIQQYEQADPGEYYRDFYAAQYRWDNIMRLYNTYY